MINRRQLELLPGSAAVLARSRLARPRSAQAKPQVVVIGGGAGGATAAKYIAKESGGAIEVTLVEPTKQLSTCFHCNLYLGGFSDSKPSPTPMTSWRPPTASSSSPDRGRDRSRQEGGQARGRRRRSPTTASSSLRASTSNTIACRAGRRQHEEAMPHAWKPGEQTQLLKARLDAVPNGGVIVMIAPPNPYRCPPGPYERVSMMAHALKTAGKDRARSSSSIRRRAFSKQALFQEGWEKHYRAWSNGWARRSTTGVKSVDPEDQHRRDRLRDLQERRARQRHSGADGGQDRARRGARQRRAASARSIRRA